MLDEKEKSIAYRHYPDVFTDETFSYENENDPIRAALADGIAGWTLKQGRLFMPDEDFRRGLIKIGRVLDIFPSDDMLMQYAIKLMKEKHTDGPVDYTYDAVADTAMYYIAEEFLELTKRIFKDE